MVSALSSKYGECSIRVITSTVSVLLEYTVNINSIMLALCSMLFSTYYAQNYAGIIGRFLH